MICPKCGKEFLSADKFCPYCGEEIKAEEPATAAEEETEVVEETEVTEETEIVEETEAEETEETEETEEAEEADAAEAEAILAAAAKAEKKSNAAVVVLAVLVAIAAVIAAFFLGGKLLGGAPAVTTEAETTVSDTEGAVTTDTAETTDKGAIPFEEEIPGDYALNYPDGYSYKDTNVLDYVTVGNYKGRTVKVTETGEFAKGEMEAYIETLLLKYAELGDAVTNRAAKLTDTVLIDYAGTIDGVAFEGGTATEQTATLGAGQFIPGFEEEIVGMQIGETRDVPVTFPANYGSAELAGKAAIFKITLHSITENVLPEYNDEFVKANLDAESVAAFEAKLIADKAESAVSEKYSAVLGLITENAVMKQFPKGAVEDYIYQQVSQDKFYAESYYGMTVEQYINGYYGISINGYEAQVRAMAEDMVKQEFAIYGVAATEGITVTDEDIANETAKYLEHYAQPDVASLLSTMGISEALFENSLHFSVTYSKVMEMMLENTTFTFE